MKKTVGIIGGGASGMMAAIAAAMHGADVTILEHTDRIGKKILVTGNGKCNFTNQVMGVKQYYGTYPDFVCPVFDQFSLENTLQFFEENGLLYKEKNGGYYPVSNQAASVLDVLRFALKRYQVKILTNQQIVDILPKDDQTFLVKTKEAQFGFQAVILACGSRAAAKTGSDGSGYELAKKLGHKIVKPVPALVQLKSSESYFKCISGIRLDVKLSLIIEQKLRCLESGELQITDYGISGIPVFQVSRIVSRALADNPKVKIEMLVDTLPEYDASVLEKLLLKRRKENEMLTVEEFLQGFSNKKMNLQFLKMLGIKANTEMKKIQEQQIKNFVELAKQWRIPIMDTNGFQNCQVCAGGVSTEQMTTSCESKLHKNLYLVGELVDIDGICGGYNLQWAWSSGYVAGAKAAE